MRFAFFSLILAVVVLSVRPARAEEPIVIGVVLPMTGPTGSFGVSVRNGLALAIDQANTKGGIGGRAVELRVLDTQGRATDAADAARALLEDPPALLVGEVTSGATLAVATEADAAGVPLLAPTATFGGIADAGARVFMVAADDAVQGRVAARWALGKGWKRAAVLADAKVPYSATLAKAFTAAFTAGGGTVIAPSYAPGTDPTPSFAAIRADRAQVVFAPGYFTDGADLIRAARADGLTLPFLGGDGWDSTQFVRLAGAAGDGATYVNHYAPDARGKERRAFIRAYRRKFSVAPDGLAALGYDTAMIALDALGRAGSLDGADVAAALAATPAAARVTGRFTFGADRRAAKPMVVVKLVKGRPRFVAEL